MPETRKCEACGGRGYFEIGAGLNALQDKYPELPIREMVQRGWLDIADEEDVAGCDEAFLRFWHVETHADVRALWEGNRRKPLSVLSPNLPTIFHKP